MISPPLPSDAYRCYALSSQPSEESHVLCYSGKSQQINISAKLFVFLSPSTHAPQWMTMLFFAILVGIIFYRLDDKEYNPQTVISDRYVHGYTL